MLGDSAEENYIETLKKTANQRGKRNYDRSRKVLTPCERVAQSFKWNPQKRATWKTLTPISVLTWTALLQSQSLNRLNPASSQRRYHAGDYRSKQKTAGHREKHAGIKRTRSKQN